MVENQKFHSTINKKKDQTHVITGFLHGCSVNEQQSKLLMESFPILRWFVPYPDSAASRFFSW